MIKITSMKPSWLAFLAVTILSGSLPALAQNQLARESLDFVFLRHLARLSDQAQSVRSHLQSRVEMSDQELDVVLVAARAAEKDITKLVVEARARTANRQATKEEDQMITAERNRIVARTWATVRTSLSPRALAGLDSLRSAFAARIEPVPAPGRD